MFRVSRKLEKEPWQQCPFATQLHPTGLLLLLVVHVVVVAPGFVVRWTWETWRPWGQTWCPRKVEGTSGINWWYQWKNITKNHQLLLGLDFQKKMKISWRMQQFLFQSVRQLLCGCALALPVLFLCRDGVKNWRPFTNSGLSLIGHNFGDLFFS